MCDTKCIYRGKMPSSAANKSRLNKCLYHKQISVTYCLNMPKRMLYLKQMSLVRISTLISDFATVFYFSSLFFVLFLTTTPKSKALCTKLITTEFSTS